MHPILVQFFGFSIHSYGVMLAVGFVVGITLAAREAVRTDVDPEKILNLSFWILVSSIIGARLFHCIVFYPQYLKDPLRILKLWEGGLVFYGGFLGALVAGFFYCRSQKLNFWEIGDLLMPSVMLGLVFGRLGCTLAGCCFGKTCGPHFAFGITFNNLLGLGVKHVPLYPTQPMSAINGFFIFLLLWLYRKHKRFHGELVAICLVVNGITRSLIEVLREDPRGFVHLGPAVLSESQLVSLFMLLFSAYLLLWVRPKQYLSPQPQNA